MLEMLAEDSRGKGFHFRAGRVAWDELTQTFHLPEVITGKTTFAGVPVVLDPSLAPGEFLLCRAVAWDPLVLGEKD